MFGSPRAEKAYFAPFVVFLRLMVLGQMVATFFDGRAFWVVATPRYWVFPLQTVGLRRAPLALVALLSNGAPRRAWLHRSAVGRRWSLLLWIAPAAWLGIRQPRARRVSIPPFLAPTAGPTLRISALRFLRLVVIVPLVEEIFWRGFLLRWLIRDDFTQVPFGTFPWISFPHRRRSFSALEHFAGRLARRAAYRRALTISSPSARAASAPACSRTPSRISCSASTSCAPGSGAFGETI